ncbi:hypothetical protein LCGC14_1353100 [marine sediment metagenome]|uniref:Uncharacterized protein n=1 Tax=marine sediment metagenome TaxID=412755 RepID=A0A0F9KWF7_9ZZZZ
MSIHRFFHPHYVVPTIGTAGAFVGGCCIHFAAGFFFAAVVAVLFWKAGCWRN